MEDRHCYTCDRTFTTEQRLQRHMRSHTHLRGCVTYKPPTPSRPRRPATAPTAPQDGKEGSMNDGAFALMLGACWVNGWGLEFYKAWSAGWMAFYGEDPTAPFRKGGPHD